MTSIQSVGTVPELNMPLLESNQEPNVSANNQDHTIIHSSNTRIPDPRPLSTDEISTPVWVEQRHTEHHHESQSTTTLYAGSTSPHPSIRFQSQPPSVSQCGMLASTAYVSGNYYAWAKQDRPLEHLQNGMFIDDENIHMHMWPGIVEQGMFDAANWEHFAQTSASSSLVHARE
ncbi:hypothetical protein HYPSUDRAFT_55083 [Hypholoma sublateritium FD-334 SS-4]|uniref:Uncharacterized protein n=1 Tax=Hypholoma sublateritium (strain FD-334 SS-4) TaxID=945553 RepID=A0A0D2P0I5_HYPSF|nr:hypothetical protein HYPSUDRAFT_55083 [Hypholoma sublateritium FD-334 SS-4]